MLVKTQFLLLFSWGVSFKDWFFKVSQAGPLGEIQVQLLDLAQLAANQMDQFIEEVAA